MTTLEKQPNHKLNKIFPLELFKFLTVGLLTMIIQLSLTALYIEIVKMDYRLGVALAYFCAVCFHFFANRTFTFKAGDKAWTSQLPRYLIILLLNFLITIAIVIILVENLSMSAYFGTLVAIAVTVSIGFIGSKMWVYQ